MKALHSIRVALAMILQFSAILMGTSEAGDIEPVLLKNPPNSTELRPMVYWSEKRTNPVPLKLHILRLDLQSTNHEVAVFISDDPDGEGPAEAKLDPPEVLLQHYGALAGINANASIGLPDAQGDQKIELNLNAPVGIYGLAAADGVIRSQSEFRRTAFWIDVAGAPHIGAPETNTQIVCGISDWRAQVLNEGIVTPTVGGDRHPLSALGLDESKRWLFLVVADGRQKGYSEGMTLYELAKFMKGIGCYNAINMDGGGSSIMFVTQRNRLHIVNNPSEKSIRPIPVMIGARPKSHD